MALPNVFNAAVADEIIQRINKLNPNSERQWGKMNVSQMLAHCNVTYEMVYDDIHKRSNAFMRFILKMLVKDKVVNEVPYKKNERTAPQFIMADNKNFEAERARLINYIKKTQQLGEIHFDGKESMEFGVLNKTEWNNMFYKHLNHHLSQFGI